MASTTLAKIGKTKLVVGADMEDSIASQAPFDIRAQYIASPVLDGSGTCNRCDASCTVNGVSCEWGSCGWWGCWHGTSAAPGEDVRKFIAKSQARNQVPLFTYYTLLFTTGWVEGPATINRTQEVALMRRYLNDFRIFLQQIGNARAMVHIEPDFWAYAQQMQVERQMASDPRLIPSAVNSANATDCSSQENNIAGLAKCMIAMTRKYAPNALVGLHGSSWATNWDATANTNPSFDVAGEARKLGNYLLALGGANTDFIAIDASDRDAGYYEKEKGRNTWWDKTNTKLPHFRQALTWAKALSQSLGKPNLWWQVPLGNMNQNNTKYHYQDNRVEYFMANISEIAQSNGMGITFGAGEETQTNPSTDGNYMVPRAQNYFNSGGVPACQ